MSAIESKQDPDAPGETLLGRMEATKATEHEPADRIVALGASAGGLSAAARVLGELPADFPAAVVVVLHLMAQHPSFLAEILDRRTSLPVTQAVDGDRLEAGRVYVAPPDAHLLVDADGRLVLDGGPPVHYVRPSIDRLLASLAESYEGRAVAVVLSGTGKDGAEGVRLVKAGGGTVLAQNSETSEHSGMPEAAVATGAVDRVLPLGEIAAALVKAVTVAEAP
jgi:two-component system, chemotaxis family, protein-glutamate methylesterase/glutaminase